MPHVVKHNSAQNRFEATVDGQQCVADYRRVGDVLVMHHTYVPPPLEGRGIAGEMVAAAVDHARAHGLKIDPVCSYVRGWMGRHPETRSLQV
jgi:predicted GNAT family acetyltransferase